MSLLALIGSPDVLQELERHALGEQPDSNEWAAMLESWGLIKKLSSLFFFLFLDPAGGEVGRCPQLVLLITASPSDPQEKTSFSSGGGLPGRHLTLFSSRLRNPLINMRRVSRTGEKCGRKDNGRVRTGGKTDTHTR